MVSPTISPVSAPEIEHNHIILPADFKPVRPSPNWDWTDEQKLVHSHMAVSRQREALMVDSKAGTGKTSSTVHGVNHYMGWAESILLTAFGKEPAEQMAAKLTNAKARSLNFHKIGYAALAKMLQPANKRILTDSKIAKRKLYMLGDDWLEREGKWIPDKKKQEAHDSFVHLLRMIRLNMTDPRDQAAVMALCNVYGIRWNEAMFPALGRSIDESNRLALDEGYADFTDMIYLPILKDAALPQYDAVIVDEAQDLSMVTMLMTLRSVKSDGFYMVIGDPWQAIMMFAGAVCNGWDTVRGLMTEKFQAPPRELKLTICQRCPVTVLDLVNKTYPEIGIRPRENAPQGMVAEFSATLFPDMTQPGDAIASRFNRPLIAMYFALVEAGRIPYFRGMGEGLGKRMEDVMSKLHLPNTFETEIAVEVIEKYRCETVSAMEERGTDPYKIDDFQEACDCLSMVFVGSEAKNIEQVRNWIFRMVNSKPGPQTVLLTSIHRFKGGEADIVFMLDPVGTLPFPGRGEQNAEQEQQERNIHYVAMTRPKKSLFINAPGKTDMPPGFDAKESKSHALKVVQESEPPEAKQRRERKAKKDKTPVETKTEKPNISQKQFEKEVTVLKLAEETIMTPKPVLSKKEELLRQMQELQQQLSLFDDEGDNDNGN